MNDRKLFKFYRSYFDVAKELPEKDQLDFLMALLEYQFTGSHRQLTGMAKFAFISQKHSIQSQIEGYLTKVGATLPPMQPPIAPPEQQEKEEEKEKEKEQVQGAKIKFFGTKGSKHFAVKSKYLHDTSSVVYPDGFTEYLDAKQFGFRFQKPFMAEMFWKEWSGKVFNDDGHMNSVLLKIQNSTL